ncbi:unnamed protein product [Polarella glacialis]|uniref:PROP1-like PPR domain-containing protein n=1 Tax=Polarella glacialis TaxID=89957 RepID=A0A813ITN8_POLGL|nr:unnamed protein product [Polarella glacialis]CAE8657685.1 unnamed protein product [Polarella glacialis]
MLPFLATLLLIVCCLPLQMDVSCRRQRSLLQHHRFLLASMGLCIFFLIRHRCSIDIAACTGQHCFSIGRKNTEQNQKYRSHRDLIDKSDQVWQEMNRRAEAGDVKGTEGMYEELKDKVPHKMRRMFLNTVIKACSKAGDLQRAESWRSEMEAAGITPNLKNYGKMIEAAAKAGDLAGAEKWLEVQRESDVPVDLTSYAAVIDASAKSGNIQSAQKWLTKALDVGLIPNIIACTAVVDACAKAGDLQSAVEWLAKTVDRGLTPNILTYTSVINACAKAGDPESAQKWLANAIEVRAAPDVVTFTSVLDACVKAGKYKMADQLFADMSHFGVRPNIITFSTLMSACAKQGAWAAACQLLDRSIEAKLRPTLLSYTTLINACGRAKPKQVDVAENLFLQMMSSGIEPDGIALRTFEKTVGEPALRRLSQDLGINRTVLAEDANIRFRELRQRRDHTFLDRRSAQLDRGTSNQLGE